MKLAPDVIITIILVAPFWKSMSWLFIYTAYCKFEPIQCLHALTHFDYQNGECGISLHVTCKQRSLKEYLCIWWKSCFVKKTSELRADKRWRWAKERIRTRDTYGGLVEGVGQCQNNKHSVKCFTGQWLGSGRLFYTAMTHRVISP